MFSHLLCHLSCCMWFLYLFWLAVLSFIVEFCLFYPPILHAFVFNRFYLFIFSAGNLYHCHCVSICLMLDVQPISLSIFFWLSLIFFLHFIFFNVLVNDRVITFDCLLTCAQREMVWSVIELLSFFEATSMILGPCAQFWKLILLLTWFHMQVASTGILPS